MPERDRARRLGSGRGRALRAHRRAGQQRGHSAARARRPRRGGRAAPGADVLVPLPRRHVGEPGRPDPDRARADRRRRPRAARLRVLPALGARLLHGASAPRARRPRRRALPRRLHLRVRRLRESGAAGDRRRGRRRSTTTGSATRSTRPIPTSRRCTRRSRSSSPGTTTRSTTTTPTTCRRTASRASRSCCAAPPPTRPTSSTCRCARSAGRGARTCRSTGRSPTAGWSTSACSTRASTGRRSPAAAARARSATAPAPPARPSSATRQREWLFDHLAASPARWHVLAQQVMMARLDLVAGPPEEFSMDKWTAYQADAQAVLDFFGTGKASNPIVLTGDIHSNWACDLHARPARSGIGHRRRPSSPARRSPPAATATRSRRATRRSCPTTRT